MAPSARTIISYLAGVVLILLGLLGLLTSVIGAVLMLGAGVFALPPVRRAISDRTTATFPARRTAAIVLVFGVAGFVITGLAAPSDNTGGAPSPEANAPPGDTAEPAAGSNPTPTTTPTPDRLGFNDTFVVETGDGERIAVTVRQADRFDAVHTTTGTIRADGVFIAVTLSFENRGDQPAETHHGEMRLVNEQGQTFTTDGDVYGAPNTDPRIPADQMQYEELQPGLSITRAVIFDVPTSGSYGFKIAPDAGLEGESPTVWLETG